MPSPFTHSGNRYRRCFGFALLSGRVRARAPDVCPCRPTSYPEPLGRGIYRTSLPAERACQTLSHCPYVAPPNGTVCTCMERYCSRSVRIRRTTSSGSYGLLISGACVHSPRTIAAAPGTSEVKKTIKAPGHLHVGEDDVHVVGSEHAHCLVGRGRVAHPAAATAQIFVYHSHEQFVLNSAAAFRVKAACADLSARWTIRLTSVAGSVSNFLIAAPARCKATHVLEAFSYSPSRIFICTGKNVHDKAHLRGPGAALGKLPD